jgi:phosphoenolpyruvate carboxykinase (diphosphate)
LIEDTIGFEQFTLPMQELIRQVAGAESPDYFVSTAHPRVVDGKPSKNPRYLQLNPNLANPQTGYLAEMSARLQRRIPLDQPVHHPVNAVLPGRRNNPPDESAGIRSLAVYNPIHYMELPELFMEFICSMTGKSPSTTGAGSEGALTKGPFNALLPIIDLNNALVSYLLTGYDGFISAAGYVGPCYRVDHDISLLIPEIWCRMGIEERDPQFLIRNHYLERCEDFDFEGRKVLASRLGYRITKRFVRAYFGRIFNHPHVVFTDEMLQPERQDLAVFADGMENIVETQKRVAGHYFNDGSLDLACPPLQALLHIMRDGRFEGKDLNDPQFRSLFTRESLLSSDWYAGRLEARQRIESALWKRHVEYLDGFLAKATHVQEAERLGIRKRLSDARTMLAQVKSAAYLEQLQGTLGAHPPQKLHPAAD